MSLYDIGLFKLNWTQMHGDLFVVLSGQRRVTLAELMAQDGLKLVAGMARKM